MAGNLSVMGIIARLQEIKGCLAPMFTGVVQPVRLIDELLEGLKADSGLESDGLRELFDKQRRLNAMYEQNPAIADRLAKMAAPRLWGKPSDDDWSHTTFSSEGRERRVQLYIEAAQVELFELLQEINWKYWKTPKPVDWDKARVEAIDALHFLVSILLLLGVGADDVLRVYLAKYDINKRRAQDEGANRNGPSPAAPA